MSRTDKDRPYDVRIRDPYEPHVREVHYHHPGWQRYRHPYNGGCDLDVFDNERDLLNAQFTYCYRTMPWWITSPYSHVPNDVVHGCWHGPERARESRLLREAVKEWNANGELDDYDYENRQARYSIAQYWY